MDESSDACVFSPSEVIGAVASNVPGNRLLHPPTSPISTRGDNDMSLTFFSEAEVAEDNASEVVVVNDNQFQVEVLQDSLEDLKKENDELSAQNRNLRNTCQSLLLRIHQLNSEKEELITQQVHKNHEIARLKLRVGKSYLSNEKRPVPT